MNITELSVRDEQDRTVSIQLLSALITPLDASEQALVLQALRRSCLLPLRVVLIDVQRHLAYHLALVGRSLLDEGD